MRVLIGIIILLSLYFSYLFLNSIRKTRRINRFSLIIDNDSMNIEDQLINFIIKTSNILESLLIFNSVAKYYDEYIDENSKINKGIYIITIKLLTGLSSIMFYFLVSIIYFKFNIYILIIIFVVGFLVPDLILYYDNKKNRKININDILRAVIIMNNCFKVHKNIEEAINEVTVRLDDPVSYQFKKVLSDIKLGLTVSEAFMRMYNRVDLDIVKRIAIILSLINKSGADIVTIFENIEYEVIEEEKIKNDISALKSFNIFTFIIVLLIPIIVFIFMLNTTKILHLFSTKYGILLLILELFIYILYIIMNRFIIRGD